MNLDIQYTYPPNKIRPFVGAGVKFNNYIGQSGSNEFIINKLTYTFEYTGEIFLPNVGLYGKMGFNYQLANGKVSYIFLNTAISRSKYLYKHNPTAPIEHTAISALTEFKIGYGIYL